MKKIFKGIAVLAATAAVGTGVAFAAGCGGTDGVYHGEYHYTNAYGATYGMVVEVTVEKNIITGIKDLTNTDDAYAVSVQKNDKGESVKWTEVSIGWKDYADATEGGALSYIYWAYKDVNGKDLVDFSAMTEAEKKQYVYDNPVSYYQWTNKNAEVWTKYENWLLQQYVGWSVADILDISVFYSPLGEPYGTDYNAEIKNSGLLLTGSTQGSGRLLLAVQDALKK